MGNYSTVEKIRKGCLVTLDPNDSEVSEILSWPKTGASYMGSRPTTQEERQQWREEKVREIDEARSNGKDTFSIAFRDDGESRLAPRSIAIPLPVERIYIVERARCQVELGWGKAQGGMTKILDTVTGETAYVRRSMLKLASNSCNIKKKKV